MRAAMIILLIGLSYTLSILITACVVAVYLAFRGNYGGLIGLSIDAAICLVCARLYTWRKSRP
jgi:hypothetical protein